MNKKLEDVFTGIIFAIRILEGWNMRIERDLNEFDFILGVLLFFVGVAARRHQVVAVIAGLFGNIALGFVGWKWGRYFFIASQFLIGLLVGKMFFRFSFCFFLGKVLGSLVFVGKIWIEEVWGRFEGTVWALVCFSVMQILLYCVTSKVKEKKKGNNLSEYYSNYPPQNLGTLILFFSYFGFFLINALILIEFAHELSINTDKNPVIWYFLINVTNLAVISIKNYFTINYVKIYTKETTIIFLLLLPFIFVLSTLSSTSFIFILLFSYSHWDSLYKFNQYVYGHNKFLCQLWISASALSGTLFCASSLFFKDTTCLKYTCAFTALIIALISLRYSPFLHPHPYFILKKHEFECELSTFNYPHSIRKSIQQDLLSKLK